ncbi:MAG: hypothetical protein ACOCVC_08705, partial [Spirochaeta sp.]
DGDRGNLVYMVDGRSEVIPAQSLFCLSCTAELAYLAYTGEAMEQVALVVNGPTSLRVDRIARRFGATVFRTEVGEANVVERAAELRREGWIVRILGEGSNGGTIIHPGRIRDPLNTMLSILKLLYLGPTEDSASPMEIWKQFSGKEFAPTLPGLLGSLPAFTTTSAYEDRAIMRIRSTNPLRLIQVYSELFSKEWIQYRDYLQQELAVSEYQFVHTVGTREHYQHTAEFDGTAAGGFKVVFRDQHAEPKGFIWMRASGTEPVFRILADAEGSREDIEATLLQWHRSLIQRADAYLHSSSLSTHQ